MDPRLLEQYNRELKHIRDMGAEFAQEYPKIALRLGLKSFECQDPYVERLLEGFAFLAARVQLRIDAEFPRFTQHLFEMVYPHYLTPTPSMAVVRFHPDLSEGSLAEGFELPRDSAIRAPLGPRERTACEYRTAHSVTLWPLELVEAEYLMLSRDRPRLDLPERIENVESGVRLRLRTSAGVPFSKISLDRLPLFLRGGGDLSMHLYEQMLANTVAVVVRPTTRPAPWHEVLDASCVRRVGFDDDQALLRIGARSFQGYRLLREYFAFPERYMFVELSGLQSAVRRCKANELDVILLFKRRDPFLENRVDATHFALFCCPVVNLFPKRSDRIHLSDRTYEHHVVPDRTRPLDFEVYEVNEVLGHGTSVDREQRFRPFYASNDLTRHTQEMAYYTVHRVPRAIPERRAELGTRMEYTGSEVYLSLVDANEAPYRSDLKELSIQTLCTNRDLPLTLLPGQGRSDFTLQTGAPVESIRCVAGPTRPRPSRAEGETAWRLISHLSLNHMSLIDTGPEPLRELLMLYAEESEEHLRRQVDGIRSIRSRPVIKPVASPGPITYARGLEITLTCDEAAFEGTGAFLLGSVLDEFFARYASINSFTRTVLCTDVRGEVMAWPDKSGRRQVV